MNQEDAAAFGGPSWPRRTATLREELGGVWASCGIADEWSPLRRVLLHRPGPEVEGGGDPDARLYLETPDPDRLRAQHDGLAEAYRREGVEVAAVEPAETPPPNQMFCADLFVMTPAGAIVGRPASTVRAGEERRVARRLADLGVPILRTVGGRGTFEGADLAWLGPRLAVLGRGMRTNAEGAEQVAATLAEQGVETLRADLSHGVMHLMGELRVLDRDLAFCRAGRTPWVVVETLRERGFDVRFFAEEARIRRTFAHNVVVLGPRRILVPAGDEVSEGLYADAGVTCVPVEVDELAKCAGAIGCLTGVLERERG